MESVIIDILKNSRSNVEKMFFLKHPDGTHSPADLARTFQELAAHMQKTKTHEFCPGTGRANGVKEIMNALDKGIALAMQGPLLGSRQHNVDKEGDSEEENDEHVEGEVDIESSEVQEDDLMLD
jgi:hypothetical protein